MQLVNLISCEDNYIVMFSLDIHSVEGHLIDKQKLNNSFLKLCIVWLGVNTFSIRSRNFNIHVTLEWNYENYILALDACLQRKGPWLNWSFWFDKSGG